MSGANSHPIHEIRITNHGKIHTWVQFALDSLQKHPDIPLLFHTLPVPKGKDVEPNKKSRLHASMSTIPRLISVVEIVKREYLKSLDPSSSQAGKFSGVHQYNQIGECEQDEQDRSLGPEEERRRAITLALSGKRHLRQHKVAYMKVTLSLRELPDLVSAGATYQQPEMRSLSKSARARLKRKLKKSETAS
ncbi:hypothetical protein DAEQUDRAFT_675993 [Daedalea quercina L-15889]|uniref:DNA/RNA-binding protein Alba-like domain-containing protein n=1 Tax=Daedalea quercina L-15889 TaxID=1314783 RepID=A0A165MM57_9APHY|nr:hypothetical protein DAEQUDRAFT_675993 [Daedalea quercina L-15889]